MQAKLANLTTNPEGASSLRQPGLYVVQNLDKT